MPAKIYFSDKKKQWIYDLYSQGMSCRKIAKMAGVSCGVISRMIERRRQDVANFAFGRKKRNKCRDITDDQIQEIIDLYKEKKTIVDICKKVKFSRYIVRKRIDEYNKRHEIERYIVNTDLSVKDIAMKAEVCRSSVQRVKDRLIPFAPVCKPSEITKPR